ncbi:hypothetical protein PPYR_03843 [Photinus pyralis]|uniref:Uncharacterized protein n=1 Tax=Photinus pyralis TaxID=7054 RepID=A0A5N4APU4_PHOPY|nr:uncharacterized protein LOC116164289 [Photinus pyralis]XP_031341340.1 uncharacterized protein LOC116169393 [Photinus pyralis]KAB0799316.1 hypothetical protein PPYR_07196 [Photinus pyralis]KAB0801657.1 hypothetical protein PPYR_03843 [Photinus pyralis]
MYTKMFKTTFLVATLVVVFQTCNSEEPIMCDTLPPASNEVIISKSLTLDKEVIFCNWKKHMLIDVDEERINFEALKDLIRNAPIEDEKPGQSIIILIMKYIFLDKVAYCEQLNLRGDTFVDTVVMVQKCLQESESNSS